MNRLSRRYSPAEASLLSQYVTDIEGDIYCIYNLPEEVVAVIFAYVSRSPLSFRDNLLKLLRSSDLDLEGLPGGRSVGAADDAAAELGFGKASERARKFHERYTVGYGHASVAEHAVVKVGVERISRFASSLLETANPFLSFTEYSQRYQRPAAGAYYVPAELESDAEAAALYRAFQDRCYRVYEQLFSELHEYLLKTAPRRDGESDSARVRRLEKLAFEDARYALTLATHTNLGMTGNARAMRDALVSLLSEPWSEANQLAEGIKTQVEKLVPTLLRYADPNAYRQQSLGTQRQLAAELAAAANDRLARGGSHGVQTAKDGRVVQVGPSQIGQVRLLQWTADAMDAVLCSAALAGGAADPGAVRHRLATWPTERKAEWVRRLLADLGAHDNPHEATRMVRYTAELLISEANWHQLLRHCRRMGFTAGPPTLGHGVTVPPRLIEAGIATPLSELAEEAAATWERLVPRYPEVAPYIVTNAHRRQVVAEFDLWQLYHLVNLRTSPEAQWDIRETVLALYDEVSRVHPALVAGAMRRANLDELSPA